jgi:hypothetical protein
MTDEVCYYRGLTESDERAYENERSSLEDIRRGLEANYRSKNWWRRNRLGVSTMLFGGWCALVVVFLGWAAWVNHTQLHNPIPATRDYPYLIQPPDTAWGSERWYAKEYHALPDGTLVVFSQDVMVKRNSPFDQGCYALPEHVTCLEFPAYTVTVKER